jgi:SAM-dependent methyltransferase
MQAETAAKLIAINRQFYQTFATPFSETRMRLQPGVIKVLDSFPEPASILDVGCGNGNLARELLRRGWQGAYLGVDSASKLLEVARNYCAGVENFDFQISDLADSEWDQPVVSYAHSRHLAHFDLILAFAVLHHLPGENTRLDMLRKVRRLLDSKGRFIHSAWQFMNNPRLHTRILPWEMVDISPADLDPGDCLLDWRQGGFGVRYVHHFSLDELQNLALQTGFQVLETFYSDGASGDLGLYQVWEPE